MSKQFDANSNDIEAYPEKAFQGGVYDNWKRKERKTMIYKIDVTQEDIDNGRRQSCHTCPIALAASRVIPKFYSVSYHSIYRVGENIDLPFVAQQFILSFDSGGSPKPLSFEVRIDD
jgi:hypothetical protein